MNRTDTGFRKPEYPVLIRLIGGLFAPRRQILGSEFAGRVDAVGEEVKELRIGDEVFGLTGNSFGTNAEYVCVAESHAIGRKPRNLSFDEAAALCEGPFLALSFLNELRLKPGARVLVNGASGSIGSSSVQLLARHFGAEVTAVCGTPNLELVRSLGATRVTGGKRVIFPIPAEKKSDIELFARLAEAGDLRPVIDRRYPLESIVEAHRYVESGQKIGTVVLQICTTPS